VNNKASNVACKYKLGRLPLIIPINKKIMKYFAYLNNKDNDSIVKQSFLMSKNLHSIIFSIMRVHNRFGGMLDLANVCGDIRNGS